MAFGATRHYRADRDNRPACRPASALLACWPLCAGCAAGSLAQALPAEVEAALARARVPRDAVAMLVADADGVRRRGWHRAEVPVNPASIAKLVTTFAALDLLGPAFTWTTPVYVEGPVRDGVLHGNLYIKGQGDPKLVLERLWLLLRRVQGLGIRTISGDIVLDRSAFEVPRRRPGRLRRRAAAALQRRARRAAAQLQVGGDDFHAAPRRPGGTGPLRAAAGRRAATQATVPLAAGECGDWRGALKADFTDPSRIRFARQLPGRLRRDAAGRWPMPTRAATRSRAVAGMWQRDGRQAHRARCAKAGCRPA